MLRKAGITTPILLLSQPRADDVDAAVHYDLQLAVYTPRASTRRRSSPRPRVCRRGST